MERLPKGSSKRTDMTLNTCSHTETVPCTRRAKVLEARKILMLSARYRVSTQDVVRFSVSICARSPQVRQSRILFTLIIFLVPLWWGS
jgi:hypothetical protein